jgi:hypothetical protein
VQGKESRRSFGLRACARHIDARKERLINLERFKENLTQEVRESNRKSSLQKICEKKGVFSSLPEGPGLCQQVLEESVAVPL